MRRSGKRWIGSFARISAVLLALSATTGVALADPLRIAALGDSLTQGYGLIASEGFTAQLQDWLDARQSDVTIVNAGVSGDTTAGGLARVNWTLSPDIDAMIVTLGGNDLLRGMDPSATRTNLSGVLEHAAAKEVPVLLIGMQAPGNYGEDYKAAFDRIYPDLAAEYDTLYVEGFLTPLTELGPWSDTLKTHMQPDGIHPNAKGVSVIVAAIGPAVLDLAERAGQISRE